MGQQVTISLYKEFQRVKRPGWIRATEHSAELEIKELHRIIEQLQNENNQNLTENILKTLKTLLQRVQRLEESEEVQEQDMLDSGDEVGWEEREAIAAANNLGIQFEQDYPSLSYGLVRCEGCHVMLERREGPVSELDAAMSCLLNEKVHSLSCSLPVHHCLRMRRVFFDLYATHSFFIDYLYDTDVLPLYTKRELSRFLETEFCGQIFEPKIRYVRENFDHDRFYADNDQYYVDRDYQRDSTVCYRDGFFVADVLDVFVNEKRGDSFYRLDGLLPFSVVKEWAVQGESHWLADWGHMSARCKHGDTVKFKVRRVYELKNWRHTSSARNVDFSELEVVLEKAI